MVVSFMIPCLDYSCTTWYKVTPVIVRVTSSLNQTDSLEKNPPTVQELQRQILQKNCRYINMLRYFARNIKGSDNYWCFRTDDLEQQINHHISRGYGPPTFFITLSCAENWWPDLRRLLYQLEKIAENTKKADAIKNGGRKEMSNSARIYPLFVNEFLMKHANSFMKTAMKGALQIEHYWGRVELFRLWTHQQLPFLTSIMPLLHHLRRNQ